jgi:hypothetical protein
MARVLSEYVSDREAKALIDTELGPNVLREISGVAAPAANQPDTDTIHFVRVPTNAIISQVLLSAADATTAGALNIGVYYVSEQPPLSTAPGTAIAGTAIDADLFASAFDLAGGPYNNQDVTFESGEYTYAESEMPLWEVLGKDSSWAAEVREVDIVGDISTTFNGGPTSIRLAVRYRH